MFKDLVSSVNSILVVGHLTPDFDAYSSVLFLGNLLKENYTEKSVYLVIDSKEKYTNLSYMKGFEDIIYGDIVENIQEYNPDLVVFVDGNNLGSFAKDIDKISSVLKGRKTAMFDHHKEKEKDFDFYIREERYSCVDVIYTQLIDREGWEIFEGYEEVYLTGLIGDSYRFYHNAKGYRETFNVVSEILDRGYTIRGISDRIFGFRKEDIELINILSSNMKYDEEKKYSYSCISFDEYSKNIKGKMSINEYKTTKRYFVDQIMVNIYDYDFCFTLAPDETKKDGVTYTCSIRSKLNTVDCTVFAKYLNGGGHITGAGCVVIANNIDEAIEIVRGVIDKYYEEARIK